jgi:AraC family transcriptional regulator
VDVLDLGALQLRVFDLTPASESRAHRHGVESWVLGAAGVVELPSPTACPRIGAGEMMRMPDDLLHHERVGPRGSRCFLLRPGRELLERLRLVNPEPRPVRDPELAELATRLARLAHVLHLDACDPLALIEAEGAALTALALGARLERQPDAGLAPWLRRVREAVDDEPGAHWTHVRLARLAGVSPEHLARRFRAAYGCTVAAYLRRRRLARARTLLVETRASLTAIALATGFADHSHFSRSFRLAFGTTPSAFRGARGRRGGSGAFQRGPGASSRLDPC